MRKKPTGGVGSNQYRQRGTSQAHGTGKPFERLAELQNSLAKQAMGASPSREVLERAARRPPDAMAHAQVPQKQDANPYDAMIRAARDDYSNISHYTADHHVGKDQATFPPGLAEPTGSPKKSRWQRFRSR